MQRDISFPETDEGLAALHGWLDGQAGLPDPEPVEKPAGAAWGVPLAFPRMQWVGQTSACPAERVLGVTLQAADGMPVRFAISVDELRAMAARIQFYRPPHGRQSLMSSDSPTLPQLPNDGQVQVPPAASSAAR